MFSTVPRTTMTAPNTGPAMSAMLLKDCAIARDAMPTAKSLETLAPQKKLGEIFAPMRQITNSLIERGALTGPGTMFRGQDVNSAENYLGAGVSAGRLTHRPSDQPPAWGADGAYDKPAVRRVRRDRSFAPAGQTTQMIVGAGGESDRSILTTGENLYRTFKMKRVYYSAYVPVVESPLLPGLSVPPPLKREHRIYQADWLLRFYGFSVKELFGKDEDDLDPALDPKVTWALRNLDMFPVEVNRAPYGMLMRVPGIGAVSAKRIVRQRRFSAVRFEDLKKMGVVMKKARYFLECRDLPAGQTVNELTPQGVRRLLLPGGGRRSSGNLGRQLRFDFGE